MQRNHQPVIAVDFDGRIAEHNDDYDLSRTEPRDGARRALQNLSRAGIKIAIWTGRADRDDVELLFGEHLVDVGVDGDGRELVLLECLVALVGDQVA